jgi:phosphoribosylformylglycinamidine synthase
VTDNLNFGSPERPEVYWQLAESCRGIKDACLALNTPVTGGNVSLYNEIQDSAGTRAIYPTPTIGMVGLITDLTKTCTLGFKAVGDLIVVLGPLAGSLGASEYLAVCHGLVSGRPQAVNLELERQVQACCYELIQRGWINSAHDCSEGGLAVTLAECCFPGGLGATIVLPETSDTTVLFGEGGARIVISIPVAYQAAALDYIQSTLGVFHQLGTVGGEQLTVKAGARVLMEEPVALLHTTWAKALEIQMGQV